MSGSGHFGYPFTSSRRDADEEEEDPRLPTWGRPRVRNPTNLGYLPYSEHLASGRNALDAVNHYRRMYERPQYPFGSSYQSAASFGSAGYTGAGGVSSTSSGYGRHATTAGGLSAGYPSSSLGLERSSAISMATPSVVNSSDRMSISPMERLLAVGTTPAVAGAVGGGVGGAFGGTARGAVGGVPGAPTPPPTSSPESSRRQWDESQWSQVTMTRPFLEAIERNDVETVKSIIHEHQRLTRCRIDPIHYAILKGHFQLIPILIEAGCNPDNPDMIGCTPLMNAIRGKLYQVVDLLLEGGANPNAPSGRKQELPLVEAVYQNDERMIEKLLARDDLDVDQTNDVCYEDETALTTAIYLGRVELVDTLLQRGANPNVGRAMSKPTPLHIGITAGAEQDCDSDVPYVICELLLAFGAIPDSVDQNGFSPLHIAAINDRDDIMDMIINAENHGVVTDIDAKSHEGETPLTVAVLHGSNRCAVKLLSAGCSFESNDDADGFPGSSLISKAFHLGYFTMVKLLLTAGASNPNKKIYVRMPRTNLGTGFHLLNRLQQYQSLLLFLSRRSKSPPSLFSLSSQSIRRTLRTPLVASIPNLPLPKKLQQALILKEELEAQLEVEPMGRPADGLDD